MSPQYMQAAVLIVLGIAAIVIAIWLLMRANRKTTVIGSEARGKDVLDDGAARAARNQALIDAPKAVAREVGQTSANAISGVVAAANATADAEAGVTVAPTMNTPDPVPAPAPATDLAGASDDLRKIKGVGPKLVTMLAEQGITSFAQIAAWTESDIERVDATLGRFKGRIIRDQWIEQAKLLASGEETAFSEKFGKNS